MKKTRGILFWISVILFLLLVSLVLYFIGIESVITFSNRDNVPYEKIKLIISLLGPLLTVFVLLNTVNTQYKSSNNLLKDSLSRDFYSLLNLFKSEQKERMESINIVQSSIENLIEDLYCVTNLPIDDEFMSAFISLVEKYGDLDVDIKNKYKISIDSDHKIKNSYSLKKDLEAFIVEEINKLFSKRGTYGTLGSYFKIFHRMIKLINQRFEHGVISYEEYSMYRGILRSNLSSNEFYVLLSNAIFSSRGTGMGIELVGSSFFGEKADIEVQQHFEGGNYYFSSDIAKKEFVYSKKRVGQRKKLRERYKQEKVPKISYYELKRFDDYKKILT